MATTAMSSSRLSTSSGRSTRVTSPMIVWWFSHMIPIVRKLTT